MSLLVTGGAGFIGSNFILYWLKKYKEYSIINLDKLTYAGNPENLKSVENNPNYKFVKGDISDDKLVNKLMKDEEIDTIVHFAAESHVDRSILDPSPFIKTNIVGTYTLLEAALKNKVRRFHHISCYDEKTRAITKDGFKEYHQIKKGDLVLSVNPCTGDLKWKPVEKVIIQDYEGKMMEINSKTVSFKVTPNHRMLIQHKKSKKFVFKEAEKLKFQSINKLPKFYQWKGEVDKRLEKINSLEDFAYILGIFIGDGFLGYQEKITPNKTGLSKEEYIKLNRDKKGRFKKGEKIGYQENTISKSWRIFLDIPENDKCRKNCEEALNKLNIKWHAHKGKAGEHLYFTSKEICGIFKDCGSGAKNKKIPDWAMNWPVHLLKKLFYGLLDSDGSRRKVFFTSSNTLVTQFAELCVKLNLSPVIKERYSVAYIEGRKVEGNGFIISFRNLWRDIRKDRIKETNYKGKIWCLTVKDDHNFLIERNGRTMFCGNTDEVFGSLPLDSKEKFNENTPYNPRSPYAASKASADHLVRAYYQTYNLPVTISNCSNNFGPYHFPEKLIPLAITNILEGKKVPVYGDGLYVRDWLFVEDHCTAIDAILNEGRTGETYLIGGMTEEISNIDIVRKILKIMGKDETRIEFVKDRPGHDRKYSVDWSKINKELGWHPKHDFDDALKLTVEWYVKNQDWWKKIKTGEYLNYYKKQYGKI